MKNKINFWQVLLGICIVLAFFGLLSIAAFYKSQMENVIFWKGLYDILGGILNGIWVLISNPTIFLILVVLILILIFRKNLLGILPSIKKIKLGDNEATFEFPQSQNIINSYKEEKMDSIVKSEPYNEREEFIRLLINETPYPTILHFNDMDGKSLTMEEFAMIFLNSHKEESSTNLRYFYTGLLVGLLPYLDTVFRFISFREDKFTFVITLEAKDLVKARIDKEKNKPVQVQ